MAESTLNDVVKKLDDVKSTIKDSNSSSATQQVKAQEVAKEAALKEDEKIGIFQDIADKLNLFKGCKVISLDNFSLRQSFIKSGFFFLISLNSGKYLPACLIIHIGLISFFLFIITSSIGDILIIKYN